MLLINFISIENTVKATSNILVPTLKRNIIVAKFGGDYSTIQEALDSANDSALNPVVIRIMPGTYYEVLRIYKGRYISLVGVDKRTCIIRNDSGDYYKAPLKFPRLKTWGS